MIVLKNEEINLLIKMENLIGMNAKHIFGKNEDRKCIVNWPDGTQTTIDKNDFLDFMVLIEKAIKDKQIASAKCAQRHKDNPEKHRAYNREWAKKKRKGVK